MTQWHAVRVAISGVCCSVLAASGSWLPAAAEEGLTEEQVKAALAERRTVWVEANRGPGKAVGWRTDNGEWRLDEEGNQVYVCDVTAAILQLADEMVGRLLTTELTVYYDPEDREVKTTRRNSKGQKGWDPQKASVAEILECFPDLLLPDGPAAPPTETGPTPAAVPPATVPDLTDDVDDEPRFTVPPDESAATEAIQRHLLQSLSVGVVDEQGTQLNPNVGRDGISLTTEDVARHARLAANGSYRTIADVVAFLAAARLELVSTGRTITVEDLLPDLQRYINTSFETADDPRSSLGLLLASGPGLQVPPQAPQMAGETAISPIASVLMLGDMLVGVPEPVAQQLGGPARVPVTRGVVTWASYVPLLGWAPAADDDPHKNKTEGAIRGLICHIRWSFAQAGEPPPDWVGFVKRLVDIWGALDDIPVCIIARGTSEKGAVRNTVGRIDFHNPGETHRLRAALPDYFMAMPRDLMTYSILLWGPFDRNASGTPLYPDADAQLVAPTGGAYEFFGATRGHLIRARSGPAPFNITATLMNNMEQRKAMLVVDAQLNDFYTSEDYWKQPMQDAIKQRLDLGEYRKWIRQDLLRTLKPSRAKCLVVFHPIEKAELPGFTFPGVISVGAPPMTPFPEPEVELIKFDPPVYLVHIIETGTMNGPVEKDAWVLSAKQPENNTLLTADGVGGWFINKTDQCLGTFGSNHELGPVLAANDIGGVAYGRNWISAAPWKPEPGTEEEQ